MNADERLHGREHRRRQIALVNASGQNVSSANLAVQALCVAL